MENYLKLQEKQNMETVLRLNKRCKKMDWAFFKKDLQYIFLNQIVSSIPSWTIRNFFYKCSGMKIGPKARIGINTVIISPKGITIGCRSVINDHCVLDGSGGITIKNDVSISAFTKIYSCTHKTDSDFFEYITNPIIIKNNVWIAANAMILDGSILNEISVIGANSCFKGVAEKGGIYYGNPAILRKKRMLDKEYKIDFEPHFR